MRILFISDLHGADVILKKSLNAIEEYDISVLILAGDLTAKDIRPIVKKGENSFLVNYRGENEVVSNSQLKKIEENLSFTGHYFFHCSESEFEDLKNDNDKIYKLMDQKTIEKLEYWMETIIDRIDLTKVIVFITPGNDDTFEIDKLLETYEKKGIHSNLTQPYYFSNNAMITLDYTNPTPWNTPRELSENKLSKLIQKKVDQLENPEKAIFNFHCPPFNTKIDLVPELDKNLKPVITPGTDNRIHIGSTSVRNAIEKYQPVVSLHGHIHETPGEDRIGKTVCLNPGNEYWNGVLHGYIVDIDNQGCVSNYYRIEG